MERGVDDNSASPQSATGNEEASGSGSDGDRPRRDYSWVIYIISGNVSAVRAPPTGTSSADETSTDDMPPLIPDDGSPSSESHESAPLLAEAREHSMPPLASLAPELPPRINPLSDADPVPSLFDRPPLSEDDMPPSFFPPSFFSPELPPRPNPSSDVDPLPSLFGPPGPAGPLPSLFGLSSPPSRSPDPSPLGSSPDAASIPAEQEPPEGRPERSGTDGPPEGAIAGLLLSILARALRDGPGGAGGGVQLEGDAGSENGGMGYEQLLRLAELIGPARPRNAQRQDVEEQLPIVVYRSEDLNKQQGGGFNEGAVKRETADDDMELDDESTEQANNTGADSEKGKESEHKAALGVNDLLAATKEKCTICLGQYMDGDELRILKCRHGFHKDCVDQWLVTCHNSCPICRGKGVESTTNNNNSEPSGARDGPTGDGTQPGGPSPFAMFGTGGGGAEAGGTTGPGGFVRHLLEMMRNGPDAAGEGGADGPPDGGRIMFLFG
ncbi:hypothetical protein HK104_001183 [Borealophlyctis nickersoniae]|nr:hypothetical protein HK104_001183 [Borealophlyctis nickersoniae]